MLATSSVGAADDIAAVDASLQALVALHTRDEVILSDARGRIVWVNEAFERGTGYTLEEVRGRSHEHVLQGPATATEAREVLRGAIGEEQPARTDILIYGRRGHSRWVEIEQTPVRDRDGNVTHFASIQRDVSGRKTLESTNRKYLAVQRALDRQAIVSTTDARGTITYVNDKFCAISGYGADELIGRTHAVVNSGHHAREFFASMWQTIGKG
ncbi:MAG: PAS domain S-box protein, partial [Pseudomonadota bacterium]